MGDYRTPGRSLKTRRGNSLIEFSLLMPWYFFLFVGVYDFGFYGYGLIALEDGVRAATLNASQYSRIPPPRASTFSTVFRTFRTSAGWPVPLRRRP